MYVPTNFSPCYVCVYTSVEATVKDFIAKTGDSCQYYFEQTLNRFQTFACTDFTSNKNAQYIRQCCKKYKFKHTMLFLVSKNSSKKLYRLSDYSSDQFLRAITSYNTSRQKYNPNITVLLQVFSES